MIYVTSDLHGDIDRLRGGGIRQLRRGDTLIVLGDFGFLWNNSKAELKALNWLSRRKYELLFIDGCHENFDLLKEYPIEEYKGGKVRVLGKRLRYLMRGEVFTIEDKKILAIGGGESEDKDDRIEGVSYWRAELPKADELDRCEENLRRHNWQVDYILTHCAPAKLLMFINLDLHEYNWFEAFLDEIMRRAEYAHWFFGRYHRDILISKKATGVYTDFIAINKEK